MNRRIIVSALAALGIAATMILSSCTPEEQAAFVKLYNERKASDKFASAISDDGLARLRQCESGGRYDIVSSGGSYRGAYQFTQSTWNSTASKHYPWLVGVDPSRADPFDQDKMTRALWATGGPQNWPVCSRRV
jgi:hypothetical protein